MSPIAITSQRFLVGKRLAISLTKKHPLVRAAVASPQRWKSTKPPTINDPLPNSTTPFSSTTPLPSSVPPVQEASTTIISKTNPITSSSTSPPSAATSTYYNKTTTTVVEPPPAPSHTGRNLALATLLLAFTGGVFFYSVDAVGNGGAETKLPHNANSSHSDPLAKLKAEAKEAKDNLERKAKQTHVLSQKQIDDLEKGMAVEYDNAKGLLSPSALQVIANEEVKHDQIKEDETHKANNKNKKPWYRFGF